MLLLNRTDHVTVKNVAKRALGINMNDPRFLDRHRVFMVLFRLGQFEAIADQLKEIGCEGINAARQNNWDSAPSKRPIENGYKKQIMFNAMWAFSKVFTNVDKRSISCIFTRFR